MRTITKAVLGVLGGLLALWVGWGVYVGRTTERVPYETLDRFDGVELRRYPRTVLVETTARDSGVAFRRLFRYITGANEVDESVATTATVPTGSETIPMTAPVRTLRSGGAAVPMTAPVRTDRREETVTMAFYLPPEYSAETAPVPTDPDVRIVVEPARTLAVRQFSWYATDDRVEREQRRLFDVLDERGVERGDDSVLLQYDAPWTPPFMRTNEVAVAVEDDSRD
jgi:hypothetical protein